MTQSAGAHAVPARRYFIHMLADAIIYLTHEEQSWSI